MRQALRLRAAADAGGARPRDARRVLPPDGGGPSWIRELGEEPLVQKVRGWAEVVLGFSLRPTAFARQWTDGAHRILNPVLMVAGSLSVLTPLYQELGRLEGDSKTLIASAVGSLAPYLHYLSLGAVAHVCLRVSGSKRPLRTSMAMALYAGGGPGLSVSVLIVLVVFVIHAQYGALNVLAPEVPRELARAGMLFFVALYLWFLWTMAAALAGAHRCSLWKAILAVAVATVVVAFPLYEVPIATGLHLQMKAGTEPRWHIQSVGLSI